MAHLGALRFPPPSLETWEGSGCNPACHTGCIGVGPLLGHIILALGVSGHLKTPLPPCTYASTYTQTLCCVLKPQMLPVCSHSVNQQTPSEPLPVSARYSTETPTMSLLPSKSSRPSEVQRWGPSTRSDVGTQARGGAPAPCVRSRPSEDQGAARREVKGFTPRAPSLFLEHTQLVPASGPRCLHLPPPPPDHSRPELAGSLPAAARRSPPAPRVGPAKPLRPPSLARPRLTPSTSCPLHLLEMYRLLAPPTRRRLEAGTSSSLNVVCPQPWHTAWRKVGPP